MALSSLSVSRPRVECRPRMQCRRSKVVACSMRKESSAAAPTLLQPLATLRSYGCSFAIATALLLSAGPADARLEGVNNPDLLPKAPGIEVIDVADFLSKGQEERLIATAKRLEKDTGVRLRILAQNYPTTPGLAIRDYWAVDENTVVFVADPNTGNIINFNVGANVDLLVPRNFWSRVAGRYGTKFYWQNNGEEAAIQAAVNAIDVCLREPVGVGQCTTLA